MAPPETGGDAHNKRASVSVASCATDAFDPALSIAQFKNKGSIMN